MSECFIKEDAVSDNETITPIHICRPDAADEVLAGLSPSQQNYAKAHNFSGNSGQAVLVPDKSGNIALVLFGAGSVSDGYGDSALQAGILAGKLYAGFYQLASAPDDWDLTLLATAWGMGAYKFNRYLKTTHTPPTGLKQRHAAKQNAGTGYSYQQGSRFDQYTCERYGAEGFTPHC